MIGWIMRRYGGMKPVVIDGFLYVVVAVCAFIDVTLRSDDVYKYMNAYMIFYVKFFIGTIGAAALALKMFRSRDYADHADDEKAKNSALNGTSTVTQAQVKQTTVTNSNEKTTDSTV